MGVLLGGATQPFDWSIMFKEGGIHSAVGRTACQSNVIMLLSGAPRIIILSSKVQLNTGKRYVVP